MSDERVLSSLFRPIQRYVRAVHLERDFHDVSALQDYVVTDQIHDAIERITRCLLQGSTQRAWRITGDYGSGKSSLALALAQICSRQARELPKDLRPYGKQKKLGMGQPRMLPVLLTGSREPLSRALLRRFVDQLDEMPTRGREPGFLREARELLDNGPKGTELDTAVLQFIEQTTTYLQKTDRAAGLLLVLDELGKFLEYAALHPEHQDVYLLQQLAELSARSNSFPFLIVGILHQGFSAYVARSSVKEQKEWEKVAGRFEEIVFRQPLDQTVRMTAAALNVDTRVIPQQTLTASQRSMRDTLQLGWYGASTPSMQEDSADSIYPIHSTTFPVLVRLFSRYGQNERSLFSFLFSREPFGLQDFASTATAPKSFYRIHHVYHYIKANMGYRLVHEPGSRWALLETLVDSYGHQTDEYELRVLETVAVLNLLDSQGLLATDRAVQLAVAGTGERERARVIQALEVLTEKRRVLYNRGKAGGYCLWPYTSVDITECYERAGQALGPIEQVAPLAEKYLEARPLVARRHYIKTGSLRYFSVHYAPAERLAATVAGLDNESDGHIAIALCENQGDRRRAITFAESEEAASQPNLLVAVPSPLEPLAPLFQEVRCWEWVRANVPELNQDRFAEREVSRLVQHARRRLRAAVNDLIGLRRDAWAMNISWYLTGNVEEVDDGREFLGLLSAVSDGVYSKAPIFHNELINRAQLSTAAAAARMRLIERIFAHPNEEYLGLDPDRKPPEMSMYLSVLLHANLHRKVSGEWGFAMPSAAKDTCQVRPALYRIQELLEAAKERKVELADVIEALREPPYGVRDGLILLLIAVFCAIHEQHVALYEEGTFVRQISGNEFSRMVKHPQAFALQYYKISGVRSALFRQLLRVLDPERDPQGAGNVLDVVRPLLAFMGQLPQYSQRSRRLSAEALAVRSALMASREPAPLIFCDLPAACGMDEFKKQSGREDKPRIEQFVRKLRSALDELRAAYPELLTRMRNQIREAFSMPGSFDQVRERLSEAAERSSFLIREPRLKGFCLRLLDRGLGEEAWLEALGSFVCAVPPKKWHDADTDRFGDELAMLVDRFQRAESLAFTQNADDGQAPDHAVRISLMQQDGTQVDQVVAISAEEAEGVDALEARIWALLGDENKRIGLAAMSRALWKALQSPAGAEGGQKKAESSIS